MKLRYLTTFFFFIQTIVFSVPLPAFSFKDIIKKISCCPHRQVREGNNRGGLLLEDPNTNSLRGSLAENLNLIAERSGVESILQLTSDCLSRMIVDLSVWVVILLGCGIIHHICFREGPYEIPTSLDQLEVILDKVAGCVQNGCLTSDEALMYIKQVFKHALHLMKYVFDASWWKYIFSPELLTICEMGKGDCVSLPIVKGIEVAMRWCADLLNHLIANVSNMPTKKNMVLYMQGFIYGKLSREMYFPWKDVSEILLASFEKIFALACDKTTCISFVFEPIE